MKNKFIIVAPLSSVSKRVRLFKITKFLHNSGIKSFEHIAWEREKGECVEKGLDFDLQKRIILRGGGYGGNKVKFMYFLWMIKVFFVSFRIKKDDTVWALGFESAFPLLLASKVKKFRLYFDDADRFSMIFSFPFPLNKLIEKCEKITSCSVYKHIIPVKERYNFESDKFYILQNTPSRTELDTAFKLYKQKEWLKAKIIININGWLGVGRGMTVALKLYEELEKEDVGFIIAGKLDCKEAELLAEKNKVQYLGKVTNAEAIASYFASDFVFTYYDPKIRINQLAASNKWGDAIFTDTGIIVNSEVKTAEFFIHNGVTISYSYNDIAGVVNKIKTFCKDSVKIKLMKDNINHLQTKVLCFEEQLQDLFE